MVSLSKAPKPVKSDIPELVDHILSDICNRNDQRAPAISENALNLLINYEYPGNIRELENILERALALSDSSEIDIEDLDLPVQESSPRNEMQSESSMNLPIDDQMKQIEFDRIIQALKETNGNVTAAAELLGTTFRSLRYRIKKLNIKN